MTDHRLPASLAPYVQAFYLQPHTGGTESPFSRQSKIYELSAPRWMCSMTIRGGYNGDGLRGKGAAVDGFLAKVGGRAGRILAHDFRRPGPSVDFGLLTFDQGETFDRGEKFLNTLIIGQNLEIAAGATTVVFDDCEPDTLLFRAGDYIGGDGRPHIFVEDVISEANGVAVGSFRPAMRSAVAAGNANYFEVTGVFRLTSDDAGSNATEVGGLESFDLEMVEDI